MVLTVVLALCNKVGKMLGLDHKRFCKETLQQWCKEAVQSLSSICQDAITELLFHRIWACCSYKPELDLPASLDGEGVVQLHHPIELVMTDNNNSGT